MVKVNKRVAVFFKDGTDYSFVVGRYIFFYNMYFCEIKIELEYIQSKHSHELLFS